jgi:hypothetical protein
MRAECSARRAPSYAPLNKCDRYVEALGEIAHRFVRAQDVTARFRDVEMLTTAARGTRAVRPSEVFGSARVARSGFVVFENRGCVSRVEEDGSNSAQFTLRKEMS